MTQFEAATITVLEHEINTLRGLRISPNIEVAEVAVQRERQLTAELEKFRAGIVEQSLLPFGVEPDETPMDIAASRHAGGGK